MARIWAAPRQSSKGKSSWSGSSGIGRRCGWVHQRWLPDQPIFGSRTPRTNCFVSEPLAHGAVQHAAGAGGIVNAERRAEAVAIVKLGEVPMQVLGRAVLVDAPHPALEDRERALNRVGVDRGIVRVDVLARTVGDDAMLGERPAVAAVSQVLIGHQTRLAADVGEDDGADAGRGHALDHLTANLAGGAVNDAQDGVLVVEAAR